MTHDDLDSAYATLGLDRDASSSAVKRQYRALVRKWHPDRFTGDSQGIAEATMMLKTVNHAFSTILEHGSTHFTRDSHGDSSVRVGTSAKQLLTMAGVDANQLLAAMPPETQQTVRAYFWK